MYGSTHIHAENPNYNSSPGSGRGLQVATYREEEVGRSRDGEAWSAVPVHCPVETSRSCL